MTAPMWIVLVLLSVDDPQDLKLPPIIISRRAHDGEACFIKYSMQFKVSPDEAQTIAEKFNKSLPDNERERFIPEPSGMVNDEYVFSPDRKTGYSLVGYRVNARTGETRFVSAEEIQIEFPGMFPKGFIKTKDLPKYSPEREKKEEKPR